MPSSLTKQTLGEAHENFRKYLPDLKSARFQAAKEQDPYQFVNDFRKNRAPPWLYNLTEAWSDLLEEPFRGVTNNGVVEQNLHALQDIEVDNSGVYEATNVLLDKLDSERRTKLRFAIDAREWRAWSNPEFLFRPLGIRLEELNEDCAQAVLAVLQATFSSEGYEKALAAMRINDFLGQLCEIPRIMNKYSYNFLILGTPSLDGAWGWSLYGHHLCISVFLKGNYIAISPTFTGAEPDYIDDGPWAGTQILNEEGDLGLRLMQSLPQEAKNQAQSFRLLRDPAMLQTGDLKIDRWNQDDQRHLCGAFRDNRVIPYEGISVSSMTDEQRELILEIAKQFLLYYPKTARDQRCRQIRDHFARTYFSWIGQYGDGDAFYFRIQSPVIIFEFDHHSGVYLTNKEPAKFHTHTIVRMPNGGDYGNALRSDEERLG